MTTERIASSDIGAAGYDRCFGHGRSDALRTVPGDSSPLFDVTAFDATAPLCEDDAA